MTLGFKSSLQNIGSLDKKRKRLRVPMTPLIVVFVVALLVSIILAMGIGSTQIKALDVIDVIRYRIGLGGSAHDVADTIVWEIRLPRVILGAVVGAGLAIAGTVIQTLVRNPLADPYLLGISSGASVGATAVITTGVLSWAGIWALSFGALVGASAAAAVVFGIAIAQGGLTPLRLVLTGTVLSSAFSAIASFLVFRSPDPQAAQSVLFWLLGSLAGANWDQILLPLISVVIILFILMLGTGWLDALASGSDVAKTLGVPVKLVRNSVFILQAVLVGVLVAVAGGIGFVGLIVPHIGRLIVGPKHRRLLPVASLLGALFLVWIDVGARALAPPQEIPLSVVTGFVGAPLFLFLLGRRHYSFGRR